MPKINIVKAIVAGVVGTVALTVVATIGAPMMGLGLFLGSLALAGGSLIGHLIYGVVVGLIYGEASSAEACSSESSPSCGCCH